MIVKLIACIFVGAVLLLAGIHFLKNSDDELIVNRRYETDIDSEEES